MLVLSHRLQSAYNYAYCLLPYVCHSLMRSRYDLQAATLGLS